MFLSGNSLPFLRWFGDAPQNLAAEWLIYGTTPQGADTKRIIEQRGGVVRGFIAESANTSPALFEGLPILTAEALKTTEISQLAICTAYTRELLTEFGQHTAHLWLADRRAPEQLADILHLDPESVSECAAALVLPPVVIPRYHAQRFIDWFRHRFADASKTVLLAAPEVLQDYAQLFPEEQIGEYNLGIALLENHVIAYTQAWDREDHWTWQPLGRSYIGRRIYALQPWGQMRCTNRYVDEFDFPPINKHAFFQASRRDTLSFLAFAPYGFLQRDASLHPVDNFGFRTEVSAETLRKRPASHIAVCVFGGSAAWGQGCLPEETFSKQLERKLNARGTDVGLSFSVLNFAQQAVMVLGEMMNYLLYADPFKPEVVIAHDGFNDLLLGQSCDPHLVTQARMVYVKHLEDWARQVHGAGAPPTNTTRMANPQAIVRAYVERRAQFARVVQGNGGIFVAGLQPYIESKPQLSELEQAYKKTPAYTNPAYQNLGLLYQGVQQSAWPENAIKVDFHDKFRQFDHTHNMLFDSCHPTPEANDFIAETYAEALWNHYAASWQKRIEENAHVTAN